MLKPQAGKIATAKRFASNKSATAQSRRRKGMDFNPMLFAVFQRIDLINPT
jgi:hypothetical protein